MAPYYDQDVRNAHMDAKFAPDDEEKGKSSEPNDYPRDENQRSSYQDYTLQQFRSRNNLDVLGTCSWVNKVFCYEFNNEAW